jgi:hypothetical protein
MSVDTDQPAVAVVFDGPDMRTAKPRVYPWTWVACWIWNLARKPRVWKWKQEQNGIYARVMMSMDRDLLVYLRKNVFLPCDQCRQAWGMLSGVCYLSLVKSIAHNMRCPEHGDKYDRFLMVNEPLFLRNDELAAKINGFR